MTTAKTIYVKRCHGLGNVVLLMPVLDYLHSTGFCVNLVTKKQWVKAFSTLRPKFKVTTHGNMNTIDFDSLTADIPPSQHRIDEFAQLLGINEVLPAPRVDVPVSWQKPFERFSDSIVFASEAAHPSRRWPLENCRRVKELFPDRTLVLVGTEHVPEIACDVDLRGRLDIAGLFGIISVSRVVITMDSAVLHIAAAVRTHTVAIFGGVAFQFRVRKEQPVVALQSKMDCCPCNKNETCNERYNCIKTIKPEHVQQAIGLANGTGELRDFFSYTNVGR